LPGSSCTAEGLNMSDFAAVYYVKGLTPTKHAELITHPKLHHAYQVEDYFGAGEYNIGLLYEERVDDFLEWCEENGITAQLL
jgi:hypothetical protein